MRYTEFEPKWQQLMADDAGQQAAQLLAQVVVSRGGFTLAMAEALAESGDVQARLEMLMAMGLVEFAVDTQRYDVVNDVRPFITPDNRAPFRHLMYCIKYLKSAPAHLEWEADNVEQALEYAISTGQPVPAALLLDASVTIAAFEWQRVIHWHERAIKHLSHLPDAGKQWINIWHHLGKLYLLAPASALRGYLPLAIDAFQQGLRSQDTPDIEDEVMIRLDLANGYFQQSDYDRQAEPALLQARAQIERLRHIMPAHQERLLASVLMLDGRVAMQLSQYADRYPNLLRAEESLLAAENIWRASKDTEETLRTQLLLGNIYFLMAMVVNPVVHLTNVLALCQRAFKDLAGAERNPVLNELETPFHNLMGKAHYELASFSDGQRHLHLALDEFDRVLQRARLPESHWHFKNIHLETLFHSANVRAKLAVLDKNPDLCYRALALYEEVLEHWTPEVSPVDYARVQYHMADAYITLRDNAAAYRCYSAAQRSFEQAGDDNNAWTARMARHYYRIVHAAPVLFLRLVTVPIARAYTFLATRIYRLYRWLARS